MSQLIIVNRKIYLNLDKELREEYVSDCVESDLLDRDGLEQDKRIDIEFIKEGISKIISTNEDFNEKYGVIQKNGIKQVDKTCMVPGGSEPSGFYTKGGGLLICPFDWSWDDKGDFVYTFHLAFNI
jgi:hypothetical protein